MSKPHVTILREIREYPDIFSLLVIADWCGKAADEIEGLQADLHAAVVQLKEEIAENDRLREAMSESYEPGCECACCELVELGDGRED